MSGVFTHLRTRPRLFIAAAVGIVAALAAPGIEHVVTRSLLGWNVGVWLYLVLAGTLMLRADHEHLRRAAIAQAEGAATVLALVIVAACVSIVAIVIELSAAKRRRPPRLAACAVRAVDRRRLVAAAAHAVRDELRQSLLPPQRTRQRAEVSRP